MVNYFRCFYEVSLSELAEIFINTRVLDIRVKLKSFNTQTRLYNEIRLMSFHKHRMVYG